MVRSQPSFVLQDDDEEEGEPKGKKAKMSNNAKGKAPSPKKNAKKWVRWGVAAAARAGRLARRAPCAGAAGAGGRGALVYDSVVIQPRLALYRLRAWESEWERCQPAPSRHMIECDSSLILFFLKISIPYCCSMDVEFNVKP